jgi:hypothetical protein
MVESIRTLITASCCCHSKFYYPRLEIGYLNIARVLFRRADATCTRNDTISWHVFALRCLRKGSNDETSPLGLNGLRYCTKPRIM